MRSVAGTLVLVWVAGLALAPSGHAEAAQPTLLILHDVPDDGFTYVGNPVHFGYVVLTDQEKTTTHKQGYIRITQNDVILYETGKDGDAAHDYDALNTFEIAFPTTGPYQVSAEVPYTGGLMLKAKFHGVVHPVQNPVAVELHVTAPPSGAAGLPLSFEYALRTPSGDLVDHSDVLFEVRRAADNFLVFRTHTHSHTEPQKLLYAFQEPGNYNVRLTGYNAFPTKNGVMFEPLTKTLAIMVAGGGSSLPGPGIPEAVPPATGTSPLVVLTGIDPSLTSTPYSQFRLSTLVYNTTSKQMEPHVNFVARVVDPAGRTLFYSKTLHEYDGDFDVVVNEPQFGVYTLEVAATKGSYSGWVGRADIKFVVAPPSPGLGGAAGPILVSADGLSKLSSGTPQKVVFHARTLAGTPAMHSEIEFQLVPGTPDQAAILTNKLHTHDSGDFEASLNFPTPGDYVLVLDAETIHGDPTPNYYWEKIGGALLVRLKVAEGVALPAPAVGELEVPAENLEAGKEANSLPGPGLGLILVSAVGFGALMRRRTL